MKVELKKYNEEFLKLSWLWLNDPEIRNLTNTTALTKESQLKWFEGLKEKKDYKIWGISVNNIPIGACGLKKITALDTEYWGYIGEKEFWGKGIGKVIMLLMEEEALKLNIKSIWLQVTKENIRALKLYIKQGYLIEKEDHEIILMRKKL